MKVTAPVSAALSAAERPGLPGERPVVELPMGPEENLKFQSLSKEESEQLAEKMNTAAKLFDKAVEFKVFEGSRIIIRVIDTKTDEVLTEFPPERLLEALRSMERFLGLLIDEKV